MKQLLQKIARSFITILVVSGVAVLASTPVHAGFGISPSDIYNRNLRPGSVYEQEFIISQSSPDKDITVSVEPDMGDTNSWFSFEPGTSFTIPKGTQRFPMKVTVTVPQNAKLQDYKGYIEIKAATGDEQQKTGVSIVKGATMEVNLVTTNVTVTRLIIQALRIEDTKPGDPINLYIKGRNEGNIGTAPSKVTMEIMNLNDEPITSVVTTSLDEIKPGKEEEILAQFIASLQPGEYFANVKVYLGNTVLREEKIVFKITGQESAGKPEVAQPKVTETSALKNKNTFQNILSSDVIGIALALLVFCVATVASAKILNKKIKTWQKISLIILVLLIGMSAIVAIARFYAGDKLFLTLRKSAPVAAPVPKATAVPQPTTEATLKVQGAKTVSQPVQPLTVSGTDKAQYKVYEKPDFSSAVVYTATEGESFTKMETKGNWYQVELPTGAWGWIHSTSLKR